MLNLEIETLDVAADVKMTRIFLVAQLNFFDTNSELEQTKDESQSGDIEV